MSRFTQGREPEIRPAWLRSSWTITVIILWAGTALVWIFLSGDMIFRAARQDRPSAILAAHLNLTAPAYFPAGHPLRHPESRHPGIDARHSPGMPWHQPHARWLAETFSPWERRP